MRLRQCPIVSCLGSSLVYRLTSARAHHLAGGGRVRGMSLMRICDVPGTGREITVRNVCFLLAGLDGTFFVQKSVKVFRSLKIQPRLDVM